MHYFCNFFHKSYIMRIVTVVGAQHKGMFLKHGGRGGGQKFSCSVMGGGEGAIFSPCIREGRGVLFFLPIDFAKPPPPLPHQP